MSSIIITNKTKTIIAPIYIKIKVNAKNSKSNNKMSKPELKNTNIRNKAEYIGFELKITIIAETKAILENKKKKQDTNVKEVILSSNQNLKNTY